MLNQNNMNLGLAPMAIHLKPICLFACQAITISCNAMLNSC